MQLFTARKPDRAEAFDLILKLASGDKLTNYDTSLLVNYFSPKLPAKAKTPFDYVAKAVNGKDIRKFLHYVHIRGGVAYASDGYRIHYAAVDLEDGIYSTAGVPALDTDAEADGEKIENLKPKSIGQWEAAVFDDCEQFLVEERIWIVKVGKTPVQLKYLKPAINHQAEFQYQAIPNGILVECEMGLAVVAEYRIPEEKR